MARTQLKSGQSIARQRKLWPLDVLFDRLEAAIAENDHGKAERLAETLAPYCHRKMAAEPSEEAKKAIQEGRWLIVAGSEE